MLEFASEEQQQWCGWHVLISSQSEGTREWPLWLYRGDGFHSAALMLLRIVGRRVEGFQVFLDS